MGFFGALDSIIAGAFERKEGAGQRQGAEQGIQNVTDLAYSRGQMTGDEQSQYQGSFDLGKLINQIYQYQMGTKDAPSGYLSPEQQYVRQTGAVGQKLYDTTLADLKDPYATYESQLQPQLKAAQDFINSDMQKRGLLSSGLNIENMGRAGTDLAIKEAAARMQYRADALQRGAGMSDQLQNTQQTNLANLSNLYNKQQGYGQTAMSRQAGQALGIMDTAVAPQFARLGQGYQNMAQGAKDLTTGRTYFSRLGDKFLDTYTGGLTSDSQTGSSSNSLGLSFMNK